MCIRFNNNTYIPKLLTEDAEVFTFLFNLRDDPEEAYDLSALYPDKVETLTALIATYKSSMVDSICCP